MKKLKKKYHFIGSEIIQRTPENCEIKNYLLNYKVKNIRVNYYEIHTGNKKSNK